MTQHYNTLLYLSYLGISLQPSILQQIPAKLGKTHQGSDIILTWISGYNTGHLWKAR